MTTKVLVGIDVGATKTHVLIESSNGEVLTDRVFATPLWRAQPYADKAELVVSWMKEFLPHGQVAALVLGAHGCDNDEESEKLHRSLSPLIGAPMIVVNDAQLLAVAADRPGSIELIAGTGSIAVGRTAEGKSVYAGGWGWLLGDEGGAAGLVRDAVRRLARLKDEYPSSSDLLEGKLLEACGVTDLKSLATIMMQRTGSEFTTWAPILFEAADEGSGIAVETIEWGAKELARLVEVVLANEVHTHTVVAAGSVIVNQRRLSEALRTALACIGDLDLFVLDVPPVFGAIRLAGHLHRSNGTFPNSRDGQLSSPVTTL